MRVILLIIGVIIWLIIVILLLAYSFSLFQYSVLSYMIFILCVYYEVNIKIWYTQKKIRKKPQKVVYSPKGRLQVPLYNNFLERVVENKRHLLVINPMYDAVQQPSQESMAKPNTPVAAEGVNADDLGFDF